MSSPEINSVLAQMRVLSQELQSTAANPTAETKPAETNFSTAMQDAIENVNAQQMQATDLVTRFETGADDTSVAEVMIEMQKASVSFQAMTEVRNRLVEAYREIMSMPL